MTNIMIIVILSVHAATRVCSGYTFWILHTHTHTHTYTHTHTDTDTHTSLFELNVYSHVSLHIYMYLMCDYLLGY